MKLIYVLVSIVLFFSGCSVKDIKDIEQKPYNYRLEPKNSLHVDKRNDERILRVQRVEGDSAVVTRSILYKKEGALKPYKYARWSELPSTRLQNIFTQALQKQAIFKATVSSKSFVIADLILESTLLNFEEVYEGDKSFVHVKMRFTLIQRRGAEFVDSILIEKMTEVKKKDTQGAVKAFEYATESLVKDLSEWLYEK